DASGDRAHGWRMPDSQSANQPSAAIKSAEASTRVNSVPTVAPYLRLGCWALTTQTARDGLES
ncbi:MAG: hypothetical protein KGO05_16260, partial [Chloroflexota bacterium]|nr:hypothetical protein [Chloroflexota bacterium]